MWKDWPFSVSLTSPSAWTACSMLIQHLIIKSAASIWENDLILVCGLITWFNNITYLILVFCCCLRNVLMHLYKYFSRYICTYILYTLCGHEKYFFKASGFFKKLIKRSKRSESDQYIIMTLSEKNVRNCTRLLDFRNVCSVRVLGNW